jgi:hypothetical protein
MFNPLADNPAARKAIYTLLWVASLAVGGIGAGYGASDSGIPDWYAPVAAVYAFVAAFVGFQASANTPADLDDAA